MTRLLLGLGTRALSSHGHYSLHEQIQVAKMHNQHVQSFVLYDPIHRADINLTQRLPNLISLTLINASLTFYLSVEDVVSSAPANIRYLWLPYDTCYIKKCYTREFPHGFLGSLTRFQHLQSLNWVACETIVHVDDFLHLLKSCPGLNQLTLKNVQIAYPESGAKADEVHTSSPVPRTGSPFLSTDTEGLYSGRRLRKLQLDLVVISDEGLERLLGLADTHSDPTARHSHNEEDDSIAIA